MTNRNKATAAFVLGYELGIAPRGPPGPFAGMYHRVCPRYPTIVIKRAILGMTGRADQGEYMSIGQMILLTLVGLRQILLLR